MWNTLCTCGYLIDALLETGTIFVLIDQDQDEHKWIGVADKNVVKILKSLNFSYF